MGIADNLVGRDLKGRGRTPRTWSVYERLESKSGTPGFFSVAYRCRDSEGNEAFLKATDLSKVLDADPDDLLGNIVKASTAHKFERDILEHCRGNRMDRVVTALDYGEENIVHDGKIDILLFLVFELAEGDLRHRIKKQAEFDLIWTFSALHEFAIGVSQLHGGEVYHNDIKPANALVFSDSTGKIADLGRATTPLMSVSHDSNQCAGDLRFAPPEQIYVPDFHLKMDDRFNFQRAGDLYNLGSLAHYLLTAVSVTQEITQRMRPEHRPPQHDGTGWLDGLSLVLPFWTDSFSQILEELNTVIADDWSPQMIEEFEFLKSMIIELCEPDWKKRGDKRFIGKSNQYNLARYITRLDLGRTRLLVSRNAGSAK